jgi:hypothetical protein
MEPGRPAKKKDPALSWVALVALITSVIALPLGAVGALFVQQTSFFRPALHVRLFQSVTTPSEAQRLQLLAITNSSRNVARDLLVRVDYPRRSKRPDYLFETLSPPADVERSENALRFTLRRLAPHETALVVFLLKAGTIVPTDVSVAFEDAVVTGREIEYVTTSNGRRHD